MPRDEKETRAAVESGAIIGSFRLEAPLGAEGPALMWHAVDTTDGAPAILKLARDEAAATRLARAAAVLAGVSHPALPKVLEDGTRHDPPYLALEAVEGIPLGPVLARGPGALAPSALASILASLADALETLHEAGLVHGDVQPANIVLRPNGLPVLADFEEARLEGSAAETHLRLTPGYAAPELYAAGSPIGRGADLYALGAIGYRAITGRVPEPGASLVSHAEGGYPFTLRAAIDWALEPAPEARPARAAEWRDALLASLATHAPPRTIRVRRVPPRRPRPNAAAPTSRAPRRRPVRRLAFAAIAAAIAVPLAFFGERAASERFRLEWVVDARGGGHATTIGDALARARDGATIRVRPGRYEETLHIVRPVTIEGVAENGERAVVAPASGPCATISAPKATLTGLVFAGGEGAEACIEIADGRVAVGESEIGARAGAALLARDGAEVNVASSILGPSGGAGLLIANGARAILADTTLRGAARSAIVLRGGADLLATDLAIEDAGQAGLLVAGGASARIERARIADTAHSGIEVVSGGRLEVVGGAIERAGGAGCLVADGGRALLQDTRIAESRLSGVLAAPSAEIELAGATIEASGEHGVTVLDLARVTLRQSRITGNGGHGVALQAKAQYEADALEVERNKEPQILDERPSRHAAARR